MLSSGKFARRRASASAAASASRKRVESAVAPTSSEGPAAPRARMRPRSSPITAIVEHGNLADSFAMMVELVTDGKRNELTKLVRREFCGHADIQPNLRHRGIVFRTQLALA